MSTLTKSVFPAELISAFEQSGLGADKAEILKKLEVSGLPDKKNEEYRFTPVTEFLAKMLNSDFEINPGCIPQKSLLNFSDSFCIQICNGKISEFNQTPEGIVILQKAESVAQKDPFAMLNEVFRDEKLFLTIKNSASPIIHLDHQSESVEKSSLSFPAIAIKVEAGVECTIIETFSHKGSGNHFSAPVLNIQVGEGSVCNYLRIQNCDGNWSQVYNSVVHQEKKSTVHCFVLTTDGAIVRNNFTLEINGEGAEGNLMGLYLLNGKTLADNHTVVDHRVPNANSNELFKGVMQGNSKGVFNGKIFVQQDAQKTNAFQSNRNIILSESASVYTKPQLEIWADDVKCSHGCTTGQLDEEALFYLQSRGIDKPSAQSMLLDAFAGEVTEKIQSESIRETMRTLVREKIASLK